MGEQRLGTLAVGLSAENAPAEGRAHGQRGDEVACRTVAQTRRLGDELVEAGIDVIGELDFGHGAQAIGPHPHRHADDPAFADGRVEHAGLAVFLLQPRGGAEDAAVHAHILAEDQHFGIVLHGPRERGADRFAEIADLGSALRIVDREPATDVQGVAGAEFFARHRGEQHSAGFDRLDVLARIWRLRTDMERQSLDREPEVVGAARERQQLLGVAAELARERPFGARAVAQNAAEHFRAGSGARDLFDGELQPLLDVPDHLRLELIALGAQQQ